MNRIEPYDKARNLPPSLAQLMTLSSLAQISRDMAALPREDIPYTTMVRELMLLLEKAVPCDSINLGTIDLATELGFHFSLNGLLMPKSRCELLPRFKHQNPMVEYARKNGVNPPLRFTDFSSRRQFEELPIYRECYIGYTYSMMTFGIQAPRGLSTSFVLSRASGDFSDNEQSQLSVLQPLVSSVLHQKMLLERLPNSFQNASRLGVIIGTEQFVHNMDDYACSLLFRYFEPSTLHTLPSALINRLKNAEAAKGIEVATPCQGERLFARINPNSDGWTIHLWQENESLPSTALSRFGFTGRQIEVIQWMARGKTNPEIAAILGISYRTVQKHLEHIYNALGVDTRIAAINRCREIAR